jgi:hypothetical protein
MESSSSGHRLVYVRLLVDAAHEFGLQPVVSLGAGCETSTEFAHHLEPVRSAMLLRSHGERADWRLIQEISDRYRCSYIVVPDADPHLGRLLFARLRQDFRLLLMRDPGEEMDVTVPRRGKLKLKRYLIAALRRRARITLFTLRAPGYVGNPHELYVNDPIRSEIAGSDFEDFVREHDITRERYWFGMAGVISRRKHPAMVLNAVAGLPSASVGVILAGPSEDNAAEDLRRGIESLRQRGIPVVRVDRTLSNSELNAAVKAMDCVVIAYETHAPPSTLGKSFALGTHCIVAGSDSLHRHAALLGHGTTCSLNQKAIRDSMEAALAERLKPEPQRPPPADRFADILVSPANGES